MADYSIGPNGLQFGGTPICSNNLFLSDVTNPGLSLKERLTEQYFRGIATTRYDDTIADMVMPMRASTSQRVDNVDEYRVAVGFDGISNSGGLISMSQPTSAFTFDRQFMNRCGRLEDKTINARGNINAQGCNPIIDGPMPYVGHESVGREAFELQAPILPLCTQDYINKDPGVWTKTLDALIKTSIEGNIYRWQLGQLRWMYSKSRFLASPIQQNLGNGRAKVPVSADLFSAYGFGRVPTHWGSPDWMAGMIRLSEIPRNQNVMVELPVAILIKYKEYYQETTGINIWGNAPNTTSDLNGYQRTIHNDALVYLDKITGRSITFKPTTRPVYVEVQETGAGSAEWAFQEKWITRDSETAGQVMPRENPNWGAFACDGKTLAAIVTVYAEGEAPFYKEPMPDNNPDAGVAGIIAKYGGGKVNATLSQLYPSALSVRLLTGLDAQVHMIQPLNQRYRDAGWTCDKFSNLMDTYVGGFVTVGGVFVENKPREVLQFMLKMPPDNEGCVDLSVATVDDDAVPAAIDFDPVTKVEARAAMNIPAPPEPEDAPAGTIRATTKTKNVKAPCTGTKTVSVLFERVGGSAGTLALAIAGTASAHASGLPTTVSFADGETTKAVTFTVAAWVCPSEDVATENFVFTFGPTNLTAGAYNTMRVCISCNNACGSGVCDPIGEGCPTC